MSPEASAHKKRSKLTLLDFRFAAFLIILALGLYVRVDDYKEWLARPHLSFFDGKPLLCETDSYYYVRLARDFLEGTYAEVDTQRHGTPPVLRPQPIPLLALLAAVTAKHTGWDLDWVAAFLPAFLGIMLALPLYGFGKHFQGTIAGLVAAIMGVLAPVYVYRSGMGWFDTDCMNATWSITVAFCFLKFGAGRMPARYAWLAAGAVAAALFFWWWDQSPEAVFGIAALPLAASVVLLFKPGGRGDRITIIACALLLAAVCFWQKEGIARLAEKIMLKAPQRYSQIAKVADKTFPAQAISTSEQTRASFKDAVDATTRSTTFFVVGLLGLGWLFLNRFREALVLSALLILAVFSFLFAMRFLIFLSPLIALGLGSAVAAIWSGREHMSMIAQAIYQKCTGHNVIRQKTKLNRLQAAHRSGDLSMLIICAVFTAVMMWQPLHCLVTGITSFQKLDAKRAAGMADVQRLTPADAVIWAWWDNGHAINYWSRRKTVIDAARHGRQLSVYNALPFAAADERFAANFIKFYAAHGLEGMSRVYQASGGPSEGFQLLKKLLALGPDQAGPLISQTFLQQAGGLSDASSWLAFLFPHGARPVYLYIDTLCLRTAYWWFWYGTWDPARQQGVHPYYEPFFSVLFDKKAPDRVIQGSKHLKVFPATGIAESSHGTMALSHILARTDMETLKKTYRHSDGYGFEIAVPARLGVMLSPDVAESVCNRLFVRIDTDNQYFLPIALKSPYYQLWEVRGDVYDGS